MEGKRYLLLIMLILTGCFVFGQSNKSIYNAYTSSDMKRWKYAMDSIDAVQKKTDKELLDLVNYQYGYVAWCIGENHLDDARRYLEKATDNVEWLEKKKYNESMLYAYKSAFIGFEIGLAKYKAPIIGMKSIEYAKKSVSIDNSNAFGYLQLGNIYFYMPKVFGGSKSEAMGYYLKSLKMMESGNEYKTTNWNYLNLLVNIISGYMEMRQSYESKKYCIKALTVEPRFDWVKNELYPQVLKK